MKSLTSSRCSVSCSLWVQTSKESFIYLLSRLSNLLQFHLPIFCQFHDVTSSVEWISLLLSSKCALFKRSSDKRTYYLR